MSQFFRIKNFEKFQHYKDRHPPWIKLYRDLWRDPAFFELTEGQRYQLISLFVLASQNDNLLKIDQKWLRHELAMTRPIELNSLVASGFIEIVAQDASNTLADSTVLAERKHLSTVETETEVQKDRDRSTETDSAHGEFMRATLTPEQYEKLLGKLNGNLKAYIERFDRWVNEAPRAKAGGVMRQDRHAYESILAWYERDVNEGKIKISEEQRSEKRMAELEAMSKKGKR